MQCIVFVFLAVHLLELEACSCSLGHIQTHFCQAGFVIKGRVISPETIIYDSFDGQMTPVSRKYEIEVKAIFKGDSTILGTATESETPSFHNSQQKTKPRRNRNRKWKRDLQTVANNNDVTQSSDALSNEITTGFGELTTRPDDIEELTDEYTIDIDAIYPTEPSSTQVPTTSAPNTTNHLWLYTSFHDASCGVRLERPIGYLIIGWVSQGQLWTGLCRHTTPWASVSLRQKRALDMNLYNKNCACQIETCYHRSCMATQRSHQSRGSCVWSPYEDGRGCYDSNSHCQPIGRKCEWRNSRVLRDCLNH